MYQYITGFIHPVKPEKEPIWFTKVTHNEVNESQKLITGIIPGQLKGFWQEIGAGCISQPFNEPNYDNIRFWLGECRILRPKEVAGIFNSDDDYIWVEEQEIHPTDRLYFFQYHDTRFAYMLLNGDTTIYVLDAPVAPNLAAFIHELYSRGPDFIDQKVRSFFE